MDVTRESTDTNLPPLLEALLGVHNAPNANWLADAAGTAAERGLGALYSLLFLLDASGDLAGERPASSQRMRTLAKLNQLLETNVTTLRFDPKPFDAIRDALEQGRARPVSSIGEALPVALDAKALKAAQRQLGVVQVWLAPLHWDGESQGLLMLFMAAKPPVPIAHAEFLGRHVAVALTNVRAKEAGRKRGEIDAVRWIYDEQRFEDQLTNEIQRAQRHKRPLSVLLIRLQNFHELRDRFGRFLAERALRQIASTLEDAMRHTDFLGAFKDDGFAAILVEADQSAAERAKERLTRGLTNVKIPNADLSGMTIELTCAIATMPVDGETASDLAAAAESRLGHEFIPQQNAA
jgi:diguanylate cyclase (GGDEF)-like protein